MWIVALSELAVIGVLGLWLKYAYDEIRLLERAIDGRDEEIDAMLSKRNV
jgi:hypothetical protein